MSPRDHMKRVQLEGDVLKAKNLLAGARVEYEMAFEAVEGPLAKGQAQLVSVRETTTLELAVNQLVALECRHVVAVERLEVFQREVMS